MSEERTKLIPSAGWASEAAQVSAFLLTLGENARDTQNDYLFLGRAPDVINLIEGKLHSYEAKLRNWKKAVEQARDHQLIVDFAWIVIPRPKKEWVEGTGIGLIDGQTFEVVVQAEPQKPIAVPQREKLIFRYWPNAKSRDRHPQPTLPKKGTNQMSNNTKNTDISSSPK